MAEEYDICINGGGPIGSTLACLLAQSGMRILLLERHAFTTTLQPALDGRAYALAEGVRPLLEEAGIWAHLPAPPQPIQHIHVLDGQGRYPAVSPLSVTNGLTFTPDDAPENRHFGWMVEAPNLLASIGRTISHYETLDVRAPETGKFTFSPHHASIALTSGERVRAKLVIAADGRGSTLRQQVKIGLTRIPYHKHALVAVLAHEHPHDGAALENFLPQGPFARLPLPATTQHPHRSAIVWTDTAERIHHFSHLPDNAFARHVRHRLGQENLGTLTPIGKRWTYPLASQYAHRYIATRLLLIGDAAHGLHPVAGQGMNLGFRDVRTLSSLLKEAFLQGDDFGDTAFLEKYQRHTRPGNLLMLAGCDVMERLFSNQNLLLSASRRLGLKALQRMPHLRRYFVQKAMGL
ncbi:ubiquinone biosynthesis protein UbiH [Saccharibacter sp. 17.LH.SD]|uniref:FAD-dependent monooxygenase n=1 Tax=Saccharibacter sp. 17.LH.SD TaxID=2689393 RepID=UPI001370BFB5|nr:FAD-dependent monooxygenase [Saccharibacter sp. 17.LH.SD]MXV44893.1 ubiquinone biosynthesis protein UbiH [Saccharibacter sp. 17.LH.SD]